jgi:hypothetical protein
MSPSKAAPFPCLQSWSSRVTFWAEEAGVAALL